ncbi:PLG [Mytilus edulis]|uniref:PLG n=1 Tax=Mytilus edulis TaxID=6550 RepID=A0A8S3TCK7_MYTED|nr:PLG [Mytilus edulis]
MSDFHSNYCRDPSHTLTPWCYTIDEHFRWEFCPVTKCDKCQQVENMPLGLTVKYNMSYGHLGALFSCKSFTANESTDHCPSSVCLSNGTWSDFSISCGVDDCYNNSSSYRGKVSCSALGTTCKRWDTVNTYDLPSDPADHPTNYCRDPKGEGGLTVIKEQMIGSMSTVIISIRQKDGDITESYQTERWRYNRISIRQKDGDITESQSDRKMEI